MKDCVLNCIIPAPVSVELTGTGKFPLNELKKVHASAGLARFGTEAQEMLSGFGIAAAAGPESGAELRFSLDPALGTESWRMQVGQDGIALSGGDEAGVFYALQALTQVVAAASCDGPSTAAVEYGIVQDSPRFSWRGFMLDPARHFQSVKIVKRVIRMMAAYRLNVLHWHLTDNQGWRYGTGIVTEKASRNTLTGGSYSKTDLQEIAAFAKKYFVAVVPEIDVPGHSRGLIQAYPELACDPADPGSELCLGRAETLPFLKRIFGELMEIFPDSRYIHFGGDEAAMTHWEKCPRCLAVMKEHGFKNLRELENHFMRELTHFAVEKGRTPIVWGTGTPFPEDTVVQAWLDIREPAKHIANGNRCIMSVHTSYYFDYPADLSEPHESWMFALPAESVYMADPYVIWESDWKEGLLGPEACLWTEYVPEWRIVQKILPRLGAYAETAWSRPENKDWHDFLRRQEKLRAAGYEDHLRSLE